MTYLSVASLLALIAVMLSLPLLPAMYELRQRQDIEPLNVIQQHAGDIRHFARSFSTVIKELDPLLDRSQKSGSMARGVLPDGSHFFVLRDAKELPTPQRDEERLSFPYVMAFSGNVTCPAELSFTKEVYARGDLIGGRRNRYRALFGERSITLGEESTIMRWAHAEGELTTGRECKLYGRVSAAKVLRLGMGCTFQRLNAPVIELAHPPQANTDTKAMKVDVSATTHRILHDSDLTVNSGEIIRGNIVVRGRLHIRTGARILGSIKSNGDMLLEPEVIVEGGVICAERIFVGSQCRLHGPVIAERSIWLHSGVQCGSLERPTTVSSPEIYATEGILVFGTLWARNSGVVGGMA